MLAPLRLSAVLAATLFLTIERAEALDIQFDYTYDTGSFFVGHADRISLLDQAAAVFESRLIDTLSGITPSGSNTWDASIFSPVTGDLIGLGNLTIQTGVIRVYVGARQLDGSTLGVGGPGSFNTAGGNTTWFNLLRSRGQTGALAATPTDFGPWGGSLTFDSDSNWYFGTGSLSGNNDFLSVATHELGHLLGLGTADSWDALVSGSVFTGPKATAANGGIQAGLSGDLAHWSTSLTSKVYGTSISQQPAMSPSITVGTQKFFTDLDFAGMQDIGWQVVPEPSSAVLLVLAAGLLGMRPRRLHP
jgi:hypothetical protein